MPVYVICGPDGVGKTTLALNTVKTLSKTTKTMYMYGGKKSNHYLPTTTITHAILKLIRRIPIIRRFARLYQTIIYYPFEYFEYWARYLVARHKSRQGAIIFVDRFVVDRMWRAQLPTSNQSKVKRRIEDKFYARLYECFFPSVDTYIFLLPDVNTIYQRAVSEYNNYEHCATIRDAYASLATHLKSLGEDIYIVEEVAEPKVLVSKLIQKLGS